MASVDGGSDAILVNASVTDDWTSVRISSISDCKTPVNDTEESNVSSPVPIKPTASSASTRPNIRRSVPLHSRSLLKFNNDTEDEHTKDEKISEPMKRFLSETDSKTKLFKMCERNVKGYFEHVPDADEHRKDEDEEELSLSPAGPIGLDEQSPLMLHLKNETWRVGMRIGESKPRK